MSQSSKTWSAYKQKRSKTKQNYGLTFENEQFETINFSIVISFVSNLYFSNNNIYNKNNDNYYYNSPWYINHKTCGQIMQPYKQA